MLTQNNHIVRTQWICENATKDEEEAFSGLHIHWLISSSYYSPPSNKRSSTESHVRGRLLIFPSVIFTFRGYYMRVDRFPSMREGRERKIFISSGNSWLNFHRIRIYIFFLDAILKGLKKNYISRASSLRSNR